MENWGTISKIVYQGLVTKQVDNLNFSFDSQPLEIKLLGTVIYLVVLMIPGAFLLSWLISQELDKKFLFQQNGR